jgi:hypothetical protein
MPLAVVARQDAATTAFDALWSDVDASLAKPPVTTSERRRNGAFTKSIGDLIAKLGGEDEPNAVSNAVDDGQPPGVATAPADVHVFTHRIRVHDEAFDSLLLRLSADAPPPGTTRLEHIFDTDEGVLLRDGYLLQLLEESGRFAVALEMQHAGAGPISQREAAQVTAIDGRWAADILAGSFSPIAVLERRFARPLPPIISAAVAVAGKQPLRRVSWRKRLRRHLGPVNVGYEQAMVTLHFEFDQISRPGNKVDCEIEATAPGTSSNECERALHHLFSHTGINWQPLTVLASPAMTRAASAQDSPRN